MNRSESVRAGGQGVRVERLAVAESTNALAKQAAESGRLKGPAWFVAARQTGGYGRFGRAWHSPEGGLWCTLAWPVANDDASRLIDGLGLRVGVAALETVIAALERAGRSAAGVRMKWPNDVLVNGKKAAGVLCEATGTREATWLVIGIGINANNDPDALPGPVRVPATSLGAETGRAIDLDSLLDDLSERVVGAIEPGVDSREVLGVAASRLFGLGETVTARLPDGGERTGRLEGLSDDGRLVITTTTGRFTAPHGTEIPHPPAPG